MSKINWQRLHFGMLFLRLGRIHDARLWLAISSIIGPFVTNTGPWRGTNQGGRTRCTGHPRGCVGGERAFAVPLIPLPSCHRHISPRMRELPAALDALLDGLLA